MIEETVALPCTVVVLEEQGGERSPGYRAECRGRIAR